ncbi:MAG: hypothetical protein ACFBSC_05045 [Microcoleaceae cyanobacterium]
MGFGELNQYAFREEPSDDPIQQIVNHHTYEDDHHWPWFLEDLETLGMNYSLRFDSCLKFFWHEDLRFSRSTIYKLYRLGFKAHPIQKLAVIEAVESIADVFLGATAKICKDMKSVVEGPDYAYFGNCHFKVDTSHTIYTPELSQQIENILIPEEISASVLDAVEEVFEIFEEFSSSLLEYAHKYSSGDPLKDMSFTDELKLLKQKAQHKVEQEVATTAGAVVGDPTMNFNFKPLGAYLIEAGLLTPDQLTQALSDQQKNSLRLGEIVAQQGWVNQQTVEYIMEKLVVPERELATAA